MEAYNVIIFVFSILTLILLIIVFLVNRMLIARNKADVVYDSVVKYIDERCLLFERMSSFVEENIEGEEKFAKTLLKARDDLSDKIKTNVHDLKEIKRTKKLLLKFDELIDIYPKVGKNEIYNLLVRESVTNIDRIDYAIDTYNKVAHEYNEFKSTKVNKIISKVLRLKDYAYYDK